MIPIISLRKRAAHAAVVLAFIGLSDAVAQSVPLFKPIPPGQPLPKLAPSVFVKRTATAAFETRALSPMRFNTAVEAAGGISAFLDLNLFADVRLLARRARLNWIAPGRFSWIGSIDDDPASQVILVSRNGGLTGTIHAHGRIFEILSFGGGTQTISELDPASLEAAEREYPFDTEGPTVEVFPDPSPTGDSLVEIDIMVLYEATVASKAGDIDAFVSSLVEAANESYVRSKVPQKIRLVHAQAIVPGSTGSGNLSWLKSNAEVVKLRDQYGADLVSMLVESSISGCGVGNVNGAFTLVKRSCALGNRSFAHELGHNMGALHNREEEGGNPTGYNYGYIDYTKNWRTIMAYATNCSCPRINNFSNPSVMNGTAPTGIADKADNARMLRSKSLTVSKFRASKGTQGNTLVVVKNGSGRVVSDITGISCGTDCEESFPVGDARTLRLTATPDSGWTFKGWEGDCQGTGACNLTMNSGKTAVARFENKNFLVVSLWDLNRNMEVRVLGDSTAIRLDSLPPRFSVVAKTAGQIGSLRFELAGPQEREHVENTPPFGLFGDSAGKALPWNPMPAPGKYRITITAFAGASGGGDELAVKELLLEVKPGGVSGVIPYESSPSQPGLRRTGSGFELEMVSAGYLELRILSPDGRIFPLGKRMYQKGFHSILVPAGFIGKGVHTLEIKGLGWKTTRRLVLLD